MPHYGGGCRNRPLVACNSETAFNANRRSRAAPSEGQFVRTLTGSKMVA
jgi:hypothetical protein